MRKTKEVYRGCLIGGAVGDAMGLPIEFMNIEEIKSKYGESGIIDIVRGRKGKGEITEDTQLTLFTAEGLLRAESRAWNKGISDVRNCIYNSYLRWLYTQEMIKNTNYLNIYNGYLITQQELYAKRVSQLTCITALASGELGTIKEPINNSKESGAIMRVAPVGLFYRKKLAFKKGMECAALTHGHPLGYLSAGIVAYIISAIIEGDDLEEAINEAVSESTLYIKSDEISSKIIKAIMLAKSKKNSELAISEIGEGWISEEALAIAIFCSIRYKNNFEKAIVAAVNHNGNSHGTGALTGNILGAYLGVKAIPIRWVKKLELIDVIKQMADDLLIGYCDEGIWWNKYPEY